MPVRSRRRVSYAPPQHGAWAFLRLPIAVAVAVSPGSPLILVLAIGWVAAYPVSYILLAMIRDRIGKIELVGFVLLVVAAGVSQAGGVA